jgi:hypothetical protein
VAKAQMVYTKLREMYATGVEIKSMIASFATDPAFSDAFDELSWNDGFDGTAIASQMLYAVNQLVTAWEANPNWRDLLLLPPLT